MSVTVMGLGVHGGGLATARYLEAAGATVTVTDLRSGKELAPALEQLPAGVRCVLGRHETGDFRDADLVVKNPAVPRSAPLLAEARAVTTDIALFLARWSGTGPLVAITGTKGKSSTSSATAHLLRAGFPGTRLGGNITVSPLTFVDELRPGDPVVLELSSFQLGDLVYCRAFNQRGSAGARSASPAGGASFDTVATGAGIPAAVLHPVVPATVAVITNIFRDHQDYYPSMTAYVEDKREIYRHLPPEGVAIFPAEDEWSPAFIAEARALYGKGRVITAAALSSALLPPSLPVPGEHSRHNMAVAAAAATVLGVPSGKITEAATTFPGVPHRLEVVAKRPLWTAINDSAATIPEAAAAAVAAFDGPVLLIAGGSDKGLDPRPLVEAARQALSRGGAVFLLEGSATPAITAALAAEGLPTREPFRTLEAAFAAARSHAETLNRPDAVILLSPGCASFGMFRNEFDRGDQFRRLAQSATR
jgi:UDP-N-acetylmuramoylalanine--D-glutamate ligase